MSPDGAPPDGGPSHASAPGADAAPVHVPAPAPDAEPGDALLADAAQVPPRDALVADAAQVPLRDALVADAAHVPPRDALVADATPAAPSVPWPFPDAAADPDAGPPLDAEPPPPPPDAAPCAPPDDWAAGLPQPSEDTLLACDDHAAPPRPLGLPPPCRLPAAPLPPIEAPEPDPSRPLASADEDPPGTWHLVWDDEQCPEELFLTVDDAGRRTEVRTVCGDTTDIARVGYDAHGRVFYRRDEVDDAVRESVQYTERGRHFDDGNHLIHLGVAVRGDDGWTATLQHDTCDFDAWGRMTELYSSEDDDVGNEWMYISPPWSSTDQIWDYDAQGRVVEWRRIDDSGEDLADARAEEQVAYDGCGRIVRYVDCDGGVAGCSLDYGSEVYTYDADGGLVVTDELDAFDGGLSRRTCHGAAACAAACGGP